MEKRPQTRPTKGEGLSDPVWPEEASAWYGKRGWKPFAFQREAMEAYLGGRSGLFFDVFRQYEPDHLLLDQARREVLEQQLEFSRLRALLQEMKTLRIVMRTLKRWSPFSFPLWAESIRAEVMSTETWETRVRRVCADLEAG